MLPIPGDRKICAIIGLALLAVCRCGAQIDPEPRELLEAGYDQPLEGQSPLSEYLYFYYNNPGFFQTNATLRMALSPTYLDGELGFKHLISPYTDLGLGLAGGGYADDYYEVRQGRYLKSESFNGYGATASTSIYQLLDPGFIIPATLVLRGGFHYATFHDASQTSSQFRLPQDLLEPFARVGVRFGGNPPVLFPSLGMELSIWYENQWRLENGSYGYDFDRQVNPDASLYWVHANMEYTFTNTGQRASFAVTAAGSTDVDRLSAWRLGGELPLAAEYPLILPGYFYEELTARRFVHLYASYDFPLIPSQVFTFRIEGAAADLDYLPGFQQPQDWQSGVGCALTFAPRKKNYKIVLRYGYGFNALRDGREGAQSVGILVQYNFETRPRSDD